MVRWCWVNFQCRGVLLIRIRVGQGPTALAVGAGGGCLDIFSLVYHFSFLSPSLWETARYRLKYCLKGPLNPKQPTNQSICCIGPRPSASGHTADLRPVNGPTGRPVNGPTGPIRNYLINNSIGLYSNIVLSLVLSSIACMHKKTLV